MARDALVRDAATSPEQQWGALVAGDVPDLSAAYAKLTGGKIAHGALPALVAGDIPDLSASYAALTGGKVAAAAMPTQAAIADLSLGTLTLLPDTITAIGTLAAKVNTLLAELRTAGLIAP